MENEARSSATAADAVSQVLDNGDLLIEILLRVGFPNTLVCAALVCKRWLGLVSDRAFLRRFRELHPPRLLGFYIEDMGLPTCTPPFVPLLPQPPELADVIRRASFNLDGGFTCRWTVTHDCRNGSVFCGLYNSGMDIKYRVHSPLCPERILAIPTLPQHDYHGDYCCDFNQVLSKEESEGRLSYFYLYAESNLCTEKPRFRVHVYMLQDGSWCSRHLFQIDQLPRTDPKAVIVDNKIYMPAEFGNIILLDLTTSSFSTFKLPRGVDYFDLGTTLLSRAHDASGVYVIHLKEFQLNIWLEKAGDNWLLVDTICLREMCADLKNSGCIREDVLLMDQVVDYGDFVFLSMGACALQLDIKSRTLRQVYETKDGCLGNIHPFMMIWPPKFPALKYDPTRNAT